MYQLVRLQLKSGIRHFHSHFFGKLDVSGAGKCHRIAGTRASDAVSEWVVLPQGGQ